MGLFSSTEEKITCYESRHNRVHYVEAVEFQRLQGFCFIFHMILLRYYFSQQERTRHHTGEKGLWRQNQTQETRRKLPFTRHSVNRRHGIKGAYLDREETFKNTDKCSRPYKETSCCLPTCFSKHLLNAYYFLRARDSQIKKKWPQFSSTCEAWEWYCPLWAIWWCVFCFLASFPAGPKPCS